MTTRIRRGSLITSLLLTTGLAACSSRTDNSGRAAASPAPKPKVGRAAPPPAPRLASMPTPRATPRPTPRATPKPGPRSAPGQRPCSPGPAGMVCIPGGPFTRGSNRHLKNERPEQSVVVSTCYLDAREVTNPAFTACVRKGLCKRPKAFLRYRGYHGATQPAVPVSWLNALKTCLLLGKRLPTEAEWEKAAKGGDQRVYPWGNERPSCKRAQYRGCRPKTTGAVGRFAPNPFGLYDMAGNGYEWVHDVYSKCWKGCRGACGPACAGPDPKGPCGGAINCPRRHRRVLRGGSWYWPTKHMRTSWRRPEYPQSGNHRLSFRCATRRSAVTPRSVREVRELLKEMRGRPLNLSL